MLAPMSQDAGGGRELLVRRAARVLLLDTAGRLLLMRGHDPAEPAVRYWFTVGGGLEPGESAVEGALRELHEETGLIVPPDAVRGPIWHEETEFGFERWWVRQSQDFYVVRVPASLTGWDPAPAALEPVEIVTVDAWAWWTVDQLRAHAAGVLHDGPGAPGEMVYPAGLAELVDQALRD
jgi:ADP-ribose pyrophosphatase YjhB (NUDIX family)